MHQSQGEAKMNICVPVTRDEGLQSPVSAHFGSAPLFMIVEVESQSFQAIPNRNRHHEHGMCNPLMALEGQEVDGLAVGGIGGGALSKLQAAGIRVYLSNLPTVEATVSAFRAGTLREVTPAEACGHHRHGLHGHDGSDPHEHGAGGPHGIGHGTPLR
jgi:predicted Fe-Mo cluster-binding NifX family protein